MVLPKPAPCRVCGTSAKPLTATDLNGRATYGWEVCRHEVRRAAKRCCDCGRPHGKTSNTALRCDACQSVQRKKVNRECGRRRYRRDPERVKTEQRRYMATEHGRELKRARDRRRNARPEVKAQHRRYLERTVLNFNAPRRQKHLASVRAYYWENRGRILTNRRNRSADQARAS